MLVALTLSCVGESVKDTAPLATDDTAPTTPTGTAGAPDCREEYESATLISVETVADAVYAIDPASGALTSLAPIDPTLDPASSITSSAFRADGSAVAADAGLLRLVSVDPCTGIVEEVGPTGSGALCGVSFGP